MSKTWSQSSSPQHCIPSLSRYFYLSTDSGWHRLQASMTTDDAASNNIHYAISLYMIPPRVDITFGNCVRVNFDNEVHKCFTYRRLFLDELPLPLFGHATPHCTEMREKLKVNTWQGKAIGCRKLPRIFYQFHIFQAQLDEPPLPLFHHATSHCWTTQSHRTSPK